MRLRFFAPIVLVVPVLTACGSSNSASNAAKAQASAIASAEAQAKAQSSSAPASDSPSTTAPSDASSSAPSSDSDNPTTCSDTTVNGYKVTDIKLTGGGSCSDVTALASSPEIAAKTFEWAVNGFHCAAGTDTMFVCDNDNSNEEIDFTATK